jgi:hypothetical protein
MALLSRPKARVVTEAQAAGKRQALRPFLSGEQKATIAATDAQVAAEKVRVAAKPAGGIIRQLLDRKKTTDDLSDR